MELIWSDIWLLECLSSYRGRELNLVGLIATGDGINRAILEPHEINGGIHRLELAGLIYTYERTIGLTQDGVLLFSRFPGLRGFERMNALEAELGSVPYGTEPSPDLPRPTSAFVSEEEWEAALAEYKKRFDRANRGCCIGTLLDIKA